MTYSEIKKETEQKLENQKGIFYAFSKKDFEEGMKKIGLAPKDTNKIIDIGSGGFILKSEEKNFLDIFKVKKEKIKDLLNNEDEAKNAMLYELINHEYGYTFDEEDAMAALGLTLEEVANSELLSRALKRAKEECLESESDM